MLVFFIFGKFIDFVLEEVLIFVLIVNDIGCFGYVDGECWIDIGLQRFVEYVFEDFIWLDICV